MHRDREHSRRTTIRVDGQEYPSPEAMPPDVRRRYEETLEALGEEGVERVFGSTAGAGDEPIVFTSERTRVRMGGEEMDLSELPPKLRTAVERQLAGTRGAPGPDGADVRRETSTVEIRHESFRPGRPRWWDESHYPAWISLLILAVCGAIMAAIFMFS